MSSKGKDRGKIGEDHVADMLEKGKRELLAGLYPGSNIAQPTEVGLYGTRDRGIVDRDFDDRDSGIEDHQRYAEHDRDDRDDHDDSRDLDFER